ncbi:MAG: ABC transporter permease, partial [Candidatus Sumerlaeota bacterium]|nr:ABC transporter permease [Candidatus Sumerlaeota bacterium]
MVNRVLLRKLARDLWARKGSLLALIAIAAVGVGCLAGIGSVYLDLDGSRRAYYADRRLADFTVACKRAPLWSVDRVAALPNVRDARGRVAMEARIDLPNRDEPITGTAISMPRRRVPVLNDVLLRSGAWFSGDEDEEAIVNDAFARENGLRPGSRIRVTLPDQAHNLLVVGTAMSPEFVFLIPPGVVGLAPDPARFGVIYLPERFLQKACGLDGACNQIVGRVFDASPAALRNTLDQIAGELDPYGVAQVTPSAEQASVRFLADELTGLKTTARTMPVIFLGVAALALNILIARMVAQQRVVIGTFRALGYSRGALTRHFLGYGVAIGAAGGIAGAGVGAWFQRLMVGVYRQFFSLPSIEAHFHPQWLLAGIAVSVAFALLGTVRGVRYAAGLQPAEAMRPPAPQRGGHIVLERIGPLWRRLSFHWKMILRAVFRNPFRSGVSLLAAVISTALILAALSGVDSLNYLINYEFRRVAHQDVTVSLRDPRGR